VQRLDLDWEDRVIGIVISDGLNRNPSNEKEKSGAWQPLAAEARLHRVPKVIPQEEKLPPITEMAGI
jgi:hypothetical protein